MEKFLIIALASQTQCFALFCHFLPPNITVAYIDYFENMDDIISVNWQFVDCHSIAERQEG